MNLGFPIHFLDTQYRMVPSICKFVSDQFYGSKLKCSDKTIDKAYVSEKVKLFLKDNFKDNHITFVDVHGRTVKKNNSFINEKEVLVLKHYIEQLSKRNIKNFSVITPYSQQRELIKKKLHSIDKNNDIEISTIDGFQGRENDIIFISLVKSIDDQSNRDSNIGFLNDIKRLNVAITAKRALVIATFNLLMI